MTRTYHTYQRPTLRQRVLTLFAQCRGRPVHYTWIAQQLGRRNPRQVREACWVLWCQGRLSWYKPGVYYLPRQEQKGKDHG